MGGRGTGSGFRASAGGQGEMPTGGAVQTTAATPGTPGRTIAVDNSPQGIAARMRILLGNNLDAATPAQRADAHGVAITWGLAADAIKRGKFKNQGFGTWEFDTDAHTSTSMTTGIGAQILQGSDSLTGDAVYEMVSWTGADQGARRYFTTRAQAETAARAEMQVRLSRWARAQQLG